MACRVADDNCCDNVGYCADDYVDSGNARHDSGSVIDYCYDDGDYDFDDY